MTKEQILEDAVNEVMEKSYADPMFWKEVEEAVLTCSKAYALECVGEDNDDYGAGYNTAKQEIRDRIEKS